MTARDRSGSDSRHRWTRPRLAALSRVPGVSAVRHQGGAGYALTVSDAGEALVRLSEWLWAKHIEPLAIEVGSESLEAVFLRLTSEAPDPPEVQP